MINRMRWRFTLAAMYAFLVVVSVVAVSVNVFNNYSVTDREDKTIDNILMEERKSPSITMMN